MILDTRLHCGSDQYGHDDPLYQILAIKAYLKDVLKLEHELV